MRLPWMDELAGPTMREDKVLTFRRASPHPRHGEVGGRGGGGRALARGTEPQNPDQVPKLSGSTRNTLTSNTANRNPDERIAAGGIALEPRPYDVAASFAFGLDIILDGLERLLTSGGSTDTRAVE